MRKTNMQKIIISIIMSFILYLYSTAQNNQYLDVWGRAGYSSLYHRIDNTKVQGGLGYSFGLGYEYNQDKFIFLGGLEFMQLNSVTNLTGYSENHDFKYPYIPDYMINYHYEFNKYREKYTVGYLNIPLQIGLKFDHFYALVGARIGLNISGSYRTSSLLETTATDPMLVDTLKNMPTHYLTSQSFENKGKLNLGFNISPCAEFGVVLDNWIYKRYSTDKRFRNTKKPPYSYRAGIFVDYGVTNINMSQTINKLIISPDNNPIDIRVNENSLLSSTLAANKNLKDFFIGVKFSVQFPLGDAVKKNIPVFHARVVDAKTKANLMANITIRRSNGNKKQVAKFKTDKITGIGGGKQIKKGKYEFSVTSDSYIAYKKIITINKYDTVLFELQPKVVPQPIPILYVKVVGTNDKVGLLANVTLSALPGNKQIAKVNTDKITGILKQQLKSGKYLVIITAPGFIAYQDTINHMKNDTLYVNLKSTPVFSVHVIDSETKANVVAEITINPISTTSKSIFKKETDNVSGIISTMLEVGKYKVNATAEGYLYSQDEVDFTKTDTLMISLKPIHAEIKMIIKNLFFELNSAVIQNTSEPALEELAQFMTKNPKVKIQIVGYTDNKGASQYNQRLSQNRANSVRDVLILKGIDPSRITCLGKGSNDPIATNDTEEGRAINRRVEFVVTASSIGY